MNISGSCLCGTVKFKTAKEPTAFRYCTCKSCQKTTGTAHTTNFVVPVDGLVWLEGESSIKRFVEKVENPGFNTWFCSNCGSFLPHISRSGEFYVVPAGLLDSPIAMRPQEIIYMEEMPEWYLSANTLKKHATEPDA